MRHPAISLIAITLMVLTLAACGGTPRIDPIEAVSAPAVELPDDRPGVSSLWRTRIGGVDQANDRLELATDGSRIFAASASGEIAALNLETGRNEWTFTVDGVISGAVGVGEGLVVVGTRDGRLIAVSAQTGDLQWDAVVGSEILAPPQIEQGAVATRTGDGAVFVLDAQSGERQWLYRRSVPALSVRGHSAPVFVRNGVVAGFENGRISALDLTEGSPAWEATVSAPEGRTDLDRMVDIDADPVVSGSALYAGSYQGRLVGMRLSNGEIVWARPISVLGGISVDQDKVYVTDDEGQLWGLDRSNGATVWRLDALAGLELSAPVRHGEFLLFGGSDGNVYWVDTDSGRILARRSIGSARITARPVVNNNIAYVLDLDGRLQALEIEN
ncbi:outer membrane protein assembly factor BamB [Spiribacter sp. C176]|uniref:Outer membrane protein assembly factor BamB n=1 Tax=Spiribacter salilacus TaxID=2664894 RepID=A0A6N7QLY9_9GAMM|nr:outer membrane protein assembly factor BamB [Spiribacter salilacus]MRH77515.1 outer membrane protein assembly factor BamB [Spiribacter salilacus]